MNLILEYSFSTLFMYLKSISPFTLMYFFGIANLLESFSQPLLYSYLLPRKIYRIKLWSISVFPSQMWKNEVKWPALSNKGSLSNSEIHTHIHHSYNLHSCLAPALWDKLFIHSSRNTLQLLAQNSNSTASVLLDRTKGELIFDRKNT